MEPIVLLQDGTVACWGDNDTGECGNNSTANANTPQYVVDSTGEKITDVKTWSMDGEVVND